MNIYITQGPSIYEVRTKTSKAEAGQYNYTGMSVAYLIAVPKSGQYQTLTGIEFSFYMDG